MKRFFKAVAYILLIHVLSLLVFSIFRLVEFTALHSMVSDTHASSLMAFVKGVWFDNVIACYISVLPLFVLLMAMTSGWCHRHLLKGITIWYCIFMSIAYIPSAANIPYFAYFFKNINSSIFGWFGYVQTTSGMLLQESSYWLYIALYFLFLGLYIYALVLIRRYFSPLLCEGSDGRKDWKLIAARVVVTLSLTALCLFGIRGRTGYNPIKVSQAYYCDDAFLNQLGINPAFNLLTSALDDMRKENKELHLMPYPLAISNTRQLLGVEGRVDSMNVLKRTIVNDTLKKNNDRPNVVVILMESMSADLLQTFGQKEPLTPTLDSLYNHSLAFTNFYSAGIHTNHGMTATLYSFPALMFRNLMKGTVTPHRKGLPTVLKQMGYENMFFMTHEAQYDNMKAFFTTNGYDDIYSQENYPKSEVVNSFGVSDHFELSYALKTINEKAKSKKPFMATVLTISNHPPYIIPSFFKPKSKDKETQIVEYADWAIGDFLKKAEKQPWFKNTIFVIQADHGKLVGKSEGELPASYNHIPLIIFGKGVQPQKYDGLGMQVDVMPTLLGLMNLNYEYEGFGVDLLKQKRDMVFYSADNQLVARDMNHCYIYEPQISRSFCYDVDKIGKLKATKETPLFKNLQNYVFSMIQTAEYITRRQQ